MKREIGKISIFLPSLRGGGAERAMLLFCEGALEQGFEVDLIVVNAVGPLKNLVPPNAHLIDLKATRVSKALGWLVKYLRASKPLAIYSTIVHANLISIIAARLAFSKTKVIIRESNSPVTETKASLSRKITHFLTPFLYPLAYKVISVSEGVKKELLQLAPSLENKIVVLDQPVVSNSMLESANQEPELAWFKKDNLPVILGMGRLHPQKDFELLIKAFKIVNLKTPSRLMIFGEGSLRGELESLVTSLGLSDVVLLPGFSSNPFPYLKNCAAFALSSKYEGMPNVLIQAMAFGTNVVATDCKSGPQEVTENGTLGNLVPVGNVEALAEALSKALNQEKNPATAQKIREKYGVEKASIRYLQAADLCLE